MNVLADDDDWKDTFKAMEDSLYERMRTDKEDEGKLTEETLTEFYKKSLKRYPAPDHTFTANNPVYYTGGAPNRNYAKCSKCDDWTTLQKGSSTCDTCLRKSYWTSMTSGGASGGGVAASTHTHTVYRQSISTQNTSSPPAEFVDVDDVEVKFPLQLNGADSYTTTTKILCKYINELHEQLADLREELEELREDL